jgi:hypothetical protein
MTKQVFSFSCGWVGQVVGWTGRSNEELTRSPLLLLFFLFDTHTLILCMYYPRPTKPFLWAFQAGIGMGSRRVGSAMQASFCSNLARGSLREPHREGAEEDTPPLPSSSSRPASGERGQQLTASSPFPSPTGPFVVSPERSCCRSEPARPIFMFCCTHELV